MPGIDAIIIGGHINTKTAVPVIPVTVLETAPATVPSIPADADHGHSQDLTLIEPVTGVRVIARRLNILFRQWLLLLQ